MGNDPHAALAAFNRFGLGPSPGDLALARSDPRGFLKEELRSSYAAVIGPGELPTTRKALQALFLDQYEKRMAREAAALAPPQGPPAQSAAMEPKPQEAKDDKAKPKDPNAEQKIFREEAMARLSAQMSARSGFIERLVAFWSNHFAVSVAKGGFVRASAGAFEREAIRPHILGKFADLLIAVEQHPAMIFFLDNQRSIGPSSRAGTLDGKGLNENLAREILELHTLGVDGGYSQADVTALARIITGWSFAEASSETGEPGAFLFKSNWHEPGAQTLLGRIYDETGRAQGELALRDLARRPATARHIATKFARHFVADAPPRDLVEALTKNFLQTDGDLKELCLALIDHDAAWRALAAKIRTPNEFVVAALRATGFPLKEPGPALNVMNALGMPLWQPGGPNGFADTASVWASPEQMKLRLDASWQMAQRVKDVEPMAALETAFGEAASRETREAVARAESRPQAIALLFMSPEFQRR
ncbi:hypothetical protein B1812_11240 [Methylocystis bryophila]|uniref:DUF1800 family protein n=1 Tax=Methylocystis bryophila TaxID=655015 RepID=A0A1W6N191_9HYPH|nr:DUF1800 family protein [Methylocystis bryophila]ARN83586.1 hypothetical protein B1812_11240 [Methylocystis bryophila]